MQKRTRKKHVKALKGHAIGPLSITKLSSNRLRVTIYVGLKRLMTSEAWWYPKRTVKIDDVMIIMELAGNPVLEASIKDGAMKLNWLNKEWESWSELQNDTGFFELVAACNASLGKGRQWHSKGGIKGH